MTNKAPDTGNLPPWEGASRIYTRLYALLAYKAPRGWVTRHMAGLGRRYETRYVCYVHGDMREVIDALDAGEEQQLKWLALHYLEEIETALQERKAHATA